MVLETTISTTTQHSNANWKSRNYWKGNASKQVLAVWIKTLIDSFVWMFEILYWRNCFVRWIIAPHKEVVFVNIGLGIWVMTPKFRQPIMSSNPLTPLLQQQKISHIKVVKPLVDSHYLVTLRKLAPLWYFKRELQWKKDYSQNWFWHSK